MSPAEYVKAKWTGTPLQRVALMAASLSVIAGALLTTMNALQVAEPYWLATRSFTRSLVAEVEKAAEQRDKNSRYQILSVQIAIKEADRRNAQGQIDRLRIELEKLPPGSPDSLRALMTEQVRVYVDQIRLIDLELDDLRRRRMVP